MLLAVALLALVHVDDRFAVNAAPGVWMGLAAAAHAGVWYPAPYAHGFYGGTRYMPLPILLELAGRVVGGDYLVSAKILIYATNLALYALVYVLARRRGAPVAVALALVAAVLSSSAAVTTVFGVRWDALATLLQLSAVSLVAEGRTRRRFAFAGLLCALALATKVSALWGPAAIVVWLVRRDRRGLLDFTASLAVAGALLAGTFELLSDGRLFRQLRMFAFAGSGHSTLADGFQRVYQLVLRNERSLPLFLVAAGVALVVAFARRRVELYELGLLFAIPILVVVLRDVGAYENHVIDLEVLAALVVAGLWGSRRGLVQLALVGCIVLATLLAARYTLVPDVRAAARHELRGRADPRYGVHPLAPVLRQGTCALFEDATIPLLAGQRPVVLDAFIVHGLQKHDPAAVDALVRRVERRSFETIVLSHPLTDAGWFATLDFGTALANAMRASYDGSGVPTDAGFFVYTPRGGANATGCRIASLDSWN